MSVHPLIHQENTKRIAQNMLILYFRMFFQMVVYFYTTRTLFATLGVSDFGIYDAVGGFVIALSFLNNAMSNSTLRFLTYAIGTGDSRCIRDTFSISVNIHLLLALLIIVIGEPIGLWYIKHKMQFPPDRYDTVWLVFQTSILSVFMMVLSVPYNTLIIAYERMSAFAYITILDVCFKLLIVLSLPLWHFETLKIYTSLIAVEAIVIRLVYGIYCNLNFPNIKYHYIISHSLYKEMLCFAGWCTFGNLTIALNGHGLNLLLNFLGGPITGLIYNSARSIAVQVQSAVTSFVSAVQTAINPQITKSYAQNNLKRTNHLVLVSARISYCFLLILVLPLGIESHFLLELWIPNAPSISSDILRLLLCISLIDALSNPLMIAADATGRIKRYHILVSLPLYATLPFGYILYCYFCDIRIIFGILMLCNLVAQIVRILICRSLFDFSVKNYFYEVMAKIMVTTFFSLSLPLFLHYLLPISPLHSLLTILASVVWTTLGIYILGLKMKEREYVQIKIKHYVQSCTYLH